MASSSVGSSMTQGFSQQLLQFHTDVQQKKLEELVSEFCSQLTGQKRDLPLANIPVICQNITVFVDEKVSDFASVLNHPVDSKLKKRLALSLVGELFPSLSKESVVIVDNLINLIVSLTRKSDHTAPKETRNKTIFRSLSKAYSKKPKDPKE